MIIDFCGWGEFVLFVVSVDWVVVGVIDDVVVWSIGFMLWIVRERVGEDVDFCVEV